DFKQIIAYDKLHPRRKEHHVPNEYGEGGRDEHEGNIPKKPIPPDAVIFKENEAAEGPGPPDTHILTPLPSINFNAIDDNIAYIPPDVNGAVGPNHVFATLNSQYRIQDRSGNIISTVSMSSFWSGIGASGTFDPKTVYDPYNNRWICAA